MNKYLHKCKCRYLLLQSITIVRHYLSTYIIYMTVDICFVKLIINQSMDEMKRILSQKIIHNHKRFLIWDCPTIDNITSQNKPTIIGHSLIQSRRGSRVSMRIHDFYTGQVVIFDCGYNRRGHLLSFSILNKNKRFE